MAAAIPVGIALYGAWQQHRAAKKAQTAMNAPVAAQNAVGQEQQARGTELYRQGQQQLAPVTNYYGKILGGDKASMQGAVAPEASQIRETYAGGARGIEQSGMQGASRDMAMSELVRSRTSALANLIPGIRPVAAQQLTGISAGLTGASMGSTSGASATYGNVAQGVRENTKYADEQSSASGKNVGTLLTQLIGAYSSKKGGGGGGGYSMGGGSSFAPATVAG